jgi:tRNA dimethylallyltransferase
MREKPKIIVIVGPTASGKSELAILIAKKFNGEIVSADSRQVYRGMDLGTGKITKKEMQNIKHHLLDVASPKRTFTVMRYVKLAQRVIAKILKRKKLPIVCGGTGFYIQALVDGILLPQVPPNYALRKTLEKKSLAELFKMLQEKDPERALTIEKKNKRRIIRALEIVEALGKVPKLTAKPLYEPLFIGIYKSPEELRSRIKMRLLKRLKKGMIAEVKRLRKDGISWQRLENFGLEYKYIALYLQKKLSYEEMLSGLEAAIWHYAKRQMTWFKRDKRIHWIQSPKEAILLVQKFLTSS